MTGVSVKPQPTNGLGSIGGGDWGSSGGITAGGSPGTSVWGGDYKAANFVANLVNSGKYSHAQSMLNRLGYHLAQDGQWGSLSKAAYSAYMRGVSPTKWNASHAPKAAPAARPRAGAGSTAASSAPVTSSGPAPVATPTSAAPASVPGAPSIQQILGPAYNQLNAQQMAANATSSQFDPIEKQLNTNLSTQQGMIPGINAATTAAYAPAVQAANALAGQNAAGMGAANQSSQNAAQSLMAMLGPNSAAAGNLAQMALNHSQATNTLSGVQQGQDRSNAAAFQGHVGDVANQVRQQRLNAVKSLQDQLTNEKSQRGLAYTKNLGDAITNRSNLLSKAYGDQSLIQNMHLAAALAGPQVTNANLKNTADAQNIYNSGVAAIDTHQLSQANQTLMNQQIQSNINTLAANGLQNFGSLKGADLASMEHAVIGGPGILDNNANSAHQGRLNVSPDQLYQATVDQYSALYGNDPKMKNAIGNMINKYMIGSRFAGHYRWDNKSNKFVKTGH